MTGRFRRGANQGRSGPEGQSALVCPSCGLRNDPSARFCRNCGLPLGWPQDPVRGTTTRHADLPSERGAGVASIIGLLAAVGVLMVAGFLVLRGSSGAGSPSPSHSPSPRPSVALDSPGASPSGIGPTTGVATQPPASPTITDTPSQPAVTEPPGTLPATTAFTCDTATIGDPTMGHWKVTHVTWRPNGTYDTIILDMSRDGDSTRSASITAETVALGDVSTQFGMAAPQNADRAVVVTFVRRVNGFNQSPVNTGLKVVPNLAMGQGSDSLWHVVLGVDGDGCHRIGVAAWDNDPTATTAQLTIDVKK